MITELDVEIAQDIVYEYGTYPLTAIQDESEHRWYTKQLIVFKDEEENSYGFYYLEPASELQEDQDRFESEPVKVFPVKGHSETVIIWNKA